MPDIAMCAGTGCPRRNECYRARAVPNENRQPYWQTPPVNAAGECNHFLKLMPGDRLTAPKEDR